MKWWLSALVLLCGCASPTAPPTVLFFGDSYTAGTALVDTTERWSTVVSQDQGWHEVNAGCPGSGFTQAALRCGTFTQRLPELESLQPDVVVIAGGINDWASLDPRPSIASTLDLAEAQWPSAQIWVVSAVGFDGFRGLDALEDINRILAEESVARGMTWIDLGQPLLGADDAMAGDGVHPNSAGHQLIAHAFLMAHSPG